MWKTCLRQTVFHAVSEFPSHDELPTFGPEIERFEAEQAYAFLLQVLCGLKSEMLGETEVLGQFKEFLQKNSEHELIRQDPSLWNSLLRDSKIVRDKYLKNLGSHSYGSLARKLLKEISGPVGILGAGHLSLEIAPWLKNHPRQYLFARDPEKAREDFKSFTKLQVKDWSHELSGDSQVLSAVLICAPLTNEEVFTVLENKTQISDSRGEFNPPLILDFRGERSFPEAPHYFSFQQILQLVAEDKIKAHQQIQSAQQLIHILAQEYIGRMQLRPMGWDDLCS